MQRVGLYLMLLLSGILEFANYLSGINPLHRLSLVSRGFHQDPALARPIIVIEFQRL
jgi:hypothetical protein